MPSNVPAVVIIGGGPRAAGVLERLAANRAALFAGRFDVHVIEPHQPGSGRIWRYDQHPGLRLNSTAADVTMFTDSSVQCEGPAAPGPGLAEWATGVLDGSITDVPAMAPALQRQLRALTPGTFPTRQLQSQYLEWFFRRAVAALGTDAPVTVHRDVAVSIDAQGGGGHRVSLAGGAVIQADVVLAALGHTDAVPGGQSADWSAFAVRHGGFHAPPSYTADVDYSRLGPGQDVIVSGMGLAFVDLLVLLTEGRGGRFEEVADGGLRYLPSGREPRFWAGSRRGVPYHSKISATLRGIPAGEPRFLTADAVDALLAVTEELDFWTQLWPLIAKEAGYAYYRELLTGYPERVHTGWEDFAARYAELDWYSPERIALVAQAVPDESLRLDFERLDQPFEGRRFASDRDVQAEVAGYIEADLRLRTGPDHSETLALFTALLKIYMDLGRLLPPERLNSRSQQTIHGWWHGFFSFVDSGPPPRRLHEILALHRAGVLQFIGPGLVVSADEETGQFQARSAQSGITVSARALVEARLPPPSVAASANPVLRALHRSGLGTEQQLISADGLNSTGRLLISARNEVLNADGLAVPGLFGIGPGTSGWGAGAFARPGTNAAPFRENDAVARRILHALADSAGARPLAAAASTRTAADCGKDQP